MKHIATLTSAQFKDKTVGFDYYGNQKTIYFPRCLLIIKDDNQPSVDIAIRHSANPSGFARVDAEQLGIMIEQLKELHKQLKNRD